MMTWRWLATLLMLASLSACGTGGSLEETASASSPKVTATATPDPCTGWTCSISGIVLSGESGQPVAGASAALHQASYCSPTRGDQRVTTDSAGRFEFAEAFFHDTDRVQLRVEAPAYSPVQWDSRDHYCLYCNCFAEPLLFTLQAAP